MTYEIEVAVQPRRAIASVAWTTTAERFPDQWRGTLDEVWAWLRRAGQHGGCNVMLYRDLPDDDRIAVEVGVEVSGAFSPSGRVRPSALPAGLAAMTTHHGPYDGLGAAHQAVRRWCAGQGRELTGERWEVYGDWEDDPGRLQTSIFYGLAGAELCRAGKRQQAGMGVRCWGERGGMRCWMDWRVEVTGGG